MNRSRIFLAALCTTALLQGSAFGASAPSTGSKKSYRWIDKSGVVHFGDTVPQEYASQGQAELNRQGVTIHETPRQMSPSEIAAAEQAAAQASKLQQHDAFLLSTYTRVKDIEQLRDERLALIEGQMEVARGSIESNQQHLISLQDRMRNFQPYATSASARRLPDQLAEEVVRALKEQRSLQQVLTSREAEKTGLRTDFDTDIERFSELRRQGATR